MNWLIWYETLFLYFRFKIFNICNVVLKLWENVCFLWVRGYLVGVVGGGVLHNRRENLKLSTNCDAAPVVATGTMVTPWHQVPGQVSGHHLHNVYLCLWSQHLLVITTGHWYVDKWLVSWKHKHGISVQHIHDLVHGSEVWFMWLLLSMNKCVYKGIHLFECWIIFPNIWLVSISGAWWWKKDIHNNVL